MRRIVKRAYIGAISAFALVGLVGGSPAYAAQGMYQTNLTQLNGSGQTGTASVEMVGSDQIRVRVNATGASPNLPHAQHLHIGGNGVCPVPGADKDNDSLISTAEGKPSYGDVKISLTTKDAVDAKSALAVDRMPKADADGVITYDRTFDLPDGVTQEDAMNVVVVSHGISSLFNDKTKYDGDKKSSLDEKLPLEATIPAACGKLTATASGSVDAGLGGENVTNSTAIIALGGVSMVMAGVLIARRHSRN